MPILDRDGSYIAPLASRQSKPSNEDTTPNAGTIVSVAVIGGVLIVVAIVLSICIFRRIPRSKKTSKTLSKLNLWSRIASWRTRSNRGKYSDQLQPNGRNIVGASGDNLSRQRSVDDTIDVEMEIARRDTDAEASHNNDNNTRGQDGGVDRHASVRSVMTLPPYSVAARPTERVLGREGERAGVDTVIEHPENVDEEEQRRDEEMESLYQIRRARREEALEREERRRQRREARARGDHQTLQRLQAESRQRSEAAAEGLLLSAQLIAEHQNKNRDRRVSSVQYHDVGLARHDGSRVRAASFESDNRPLLDSAASIGGRPDSVSTISVHQRGRSASSVNSISSMATTDIVDRQNVDFEVISLDDRSLTTSRSPSTDLAGVPTTTSLEEPPHYEHLVWGDAPPYESPVVAQGEAPQLPRLAPVPSIQITVARSPDLSPRSPNIPCQSR